MWRLFDVKWLDVARIFLRVYVGIKVVAYAPAVHSTGRGIRCVAGDSGNGTFDWLLLWLNRCCCNAIAGEVDAFVGIHYAGQDVRRVRRVSLGIHRFRATAERFYYRKPKQILIL